MHLIASYGSSLNIDFKQFSNTLEELVLESENLSDSAFKSLASLTKLRVLSLTSVGANYEGLFHEILGSLKQLRYKLIN